ncbi:hypothetical protein GCM10025867_31790 [Frondihabitans sucicola]|uniref:DUF4131 domain-containing protein n=1 Tax=Frondihabitans sucicola TaxID=1268041 RepID=A0ABN6Y170_9MICO|nr:hypothetical protein [Frondihabitans sucicola]BDZ50938.1 hypothetical protein GCM10025867_31790 [Frondihabitans sucicola]
MIDVRLAVPAAAAWVALVVALPAPEALPQIAAASAAAGLGAVAGGLVVARSSRQRRRRGTILPAVALVLIAVAAATTSAALRDAERRPAAAVEAVRQGAEVHLRGVVTAVDPATGHLRMTAAVLTRREPVRVRFPVFVVRATFGSEVPRAGDTAALSGRLADSSPGDQVSFLLHPTGEVEVSRAQPGLQSWAGAVREGFATLTQRLPGDGEPSCPGSASATRAASTPASIRR